MITEAYHDCPRFDKCNVNDCPLSKIKYLSDESDKETKCTLPKTIRMRIAKQHNLASGGLRDRERTAMQRWASLPETEKQARIEKIKKICSATRLLAKGCRIIPPKINQPYNIGEKEQTSSKSSILGARTEHQEVLQ